MAKANAPKTVKQPATTAIKPATTGQPQFTNDGKKYRVIMHAVNIAGKGTVTAADIASDEEIQKYLLELDTVGSVIELVVD